MLPPKTVDADYCAFPTYNEKVRVTGTYLGHPDNKVGSSGIIRVGHTYIIVGNQLEGFEGKTVTVDGYFIERPDSIFNVVHIDGGYVYPQSFVIENVHAVN